MQDGMTPTRPSRPGLYLLRGRLGLRQPGRWLLLAPGRCSPARRAGPPGRGGL